MSKIKKICFNCGDKYNLYEIYNQNGKFICGDCLYDSDDYAECCICKKEEKKIAYSIEEDLKHCDDDDKYYCEEHYGGDDGELSEDKLDLIEYNNKN